MSSASGGGPSASTQKPHSKARAGGKVKKQKQKDGKERYNPKAFGFSGGVVAAQRHFQRTQDLQAKRARADLIVDKTPTVAPPPFVIVVQGPKNVGKSTLIKSLVKHYTRHTISAVKGPVTLVSGKNRRVTFLECPNSVTGMIDAAKVADLALLMIDASYGFEMETFEFLNVMQVHGFPKVIGVLTHLDQLKDGKLVRKVKKQMKKRFWDEIYDGAKLFYLSGLQYKRYNKREILNLSRFIAVQKQVQLTFRSTHTYCVALRCVDETLKGSENPGSLQSDVQSDPTARNGPDKRVVSFFGYVQGCAMREGSSVHVPGAGDFVIEKLSTTLDPCPLPESGPGKAGDSNRALRSLKSKERLIYAPDCDIGTVQFDENAMYIELPEHKVGFTSKAALKQRSARRGSSESSSADNGWTSGSEEESEKDEKTMTEAVAMVRELQKAEGGLHKSVRGRSVQLLADTEGENEFDASMKHDTEDSSDGFVDNGADNDGGDGDDDDVDDDDDDDVKEEDDGDDDEEGKAEDEDEDEDQGDENQSSAEGSTESGGDEGAGQATAAVVTSADGSGRRKAPKRLMPIKPKKVTRRAIPREVQEEREREASKPAVEYWDTDTDTDGGRGDGEERELTLEYVGDSEGLRDCDCEVQKMGKGYEADPIGEDAHSIDELMLKNKRALTLEDLVYERSTLSVQDQADWDSEVFHLAIGRASARRTETISGSASKKGRDLLSDSEEDEKEERGSSSHAAVSSGVVGGDTDAPDVSGVSDLDLYASVGKSVTSLSDIDAFWSAEVFAVLKKRKFITGGWDAGKSGDVDSDAEGEGGDTKGPKETAKAKVPDDDGDDSEAEAEAVRLKEEERRQNLHEVREELSRSATGVTHIAQIGAYVKVTVSGVPGLWVDTYVHSRDAKRLIFLGGLLPGESNFGVLQCRVKRHRWAPKILKTRDPLLISVGWRRFQTVPIYCLEDRNGARVRMLKYTPEHLHCLAAFYGPVSPPGTGVLGIHNFFDRGFSSYRISATGLVLSASPTFRIVKKLKLVGEPKKIHKNTALIKKMLNSDLEVAKCIGTKIQTVSGIRGRIRKAVGTDGTFRATFEDKILMSDVVLCKAWTAVEIPRVYIPVLDLPGWRRVRTIGELRKEHEVPMPFNPNSTYGAKPERQARRFNPLKIPKSLEKQLPFATRPKLTVKKKRDALVEEAKASLLMSDRDRAVATVLQRLQTIKNARTEQKRRKNQLKLAEKAKMEAKVQERRDAVTKDKKRRKHALQGAKEQRQRKRLRIDD